MDASPLPVQPDIDALLQEIESVHLTDYWRAEALADEVLRLAAEARLLVKTAEALAYKAWARAHLYDSESALRSALDALIIAREHHALRVEYLALRSLAMVFEQGGLPDEALRLYELQRTIVAQFGQPYLESSVLNNIGTVEFTRDPLKAAKIFQKALAILPREESNHARRIIMSWNAATALALTGQTEAAMKFGADALRIAQETGSRYWEARVQATVAYLFALQGDFAQAHALIEALRPKLRDLAFPVVNVEFYQQFGQILLEEGRFHEAAAALEQAYDDTTAHGLINVQIDILKMLSRCYEALGDMTGVVQTYKRMTEGVVNQQRRGADMRFAVLKTAFDIDRASIEAKARAGEYQASALHRLSHEFRTPLDVIKSNASMVAQYGDHISPEATRARLEEITTQVQWMTVMMDDIAELLQPDSDNFPAVSFTLDGLRLAVLQDVSSYRLDIRRVLTETTGSLTAALHGTFDPLRRALVQIIANALKFSSGPVRLRLAVNMGALTAVVRDEGIGIPAAELPLVMRPMYRASNAGDVSGTGLGLALVDKLVKGGGASFALESETGAPTTATLRWPLSG